MLKRQYGQDLVSGNKKVIHPILLYLLQNFEMISKRAFIAKYIIPLQIPNEFLIDAEMKNSLDQYKDLQAEFQVLHEQYEKIRQEALNPNELRKEIEISEQEKEQLKAKINIFKGKNQGKEDFDKILAATNKLRLEQEEEAKLYDKLQSTREYLDWSENNLLEAQQRLIDVRKTLSPDNSPEQMLQAMKAEVKKNRDFCNDRLKVDIQEKKARFVFLQDLMSKPPISQEECINLESHLNMLKRIVSQLTTRVSTEKNPEEDKLHIFKTQAALVAKKKDKSQDDLKRVNEQVEILLKKIEEKEKLVNRRGSIGGNNFNDFAASLRDKTSKYKKMKEELKDVESEIKILTRTISILNSKKSYFDSFTKNINSKDSNLNEIKEKIQLVLELPDSDESKKKIMDEIEKKMQNIDGEIHAKKQYLQPKLNELKSLRKQYEDVDSVYKLKKSEFEQVNAVIQTENQNLETEYQKNKIQVYNEDSKLQLLLYTTEIIDQKLKRLNKEVDFQSGKSKLNNEFNSYQDLFINKIAKQEAYIKELKENRELVKQNYEPAMNQVQMFSDLKKILELKIMIVKANKIEVEDKGSNNRLVL